MDIPSYLVEPIVSYLHLKELVLSVQNIEETPKMPLSWIYNIP